MALLQQTLAECTQDTLYDFTPRNKKVNDINLYINNVPIGRVYVTKCLGVQIGSQLNIEYTSKK